MTESAWFASSDAALVRAGVLLLEAASRSSQSATLPEHAEILARLAGMTSDVWDAMGEQALEGFERVDGGWRHRAMFDLQAAVQERFGAQLQDLAASSVLACQAVDEFSLIGEVKPAGRSKGKKALPKDYVFSPELLKKAEAAGFISPEHQDWLLGKFKDFASADTRLKSNWDATARNYFTSAITGRDFFSFFGYWPRESRERLAGGSGGDVGRRNAPQTFEKTALNASNATMQRVLSARYGSAGTQDASAQDVPFRAPAPERTMGFGFRSGSAGGTR